jgi:hypothetical protein
VYQNHLVSERLRGAVARLCGRAFPAGSAMGFSVRPRARSKTERARGPVTSIASRCGTRVDHVQDRCPSFRPTLAMRASGIRCAIRSWPLAGSRTSGRTSGRSCQGSRSRVRRVRAPTRTRPRPTWRRRARSRARRAGGRANERDLLHLREFGPRRSPAGLVLGLGANHPLLLDHVEPIDTSRRLTLVGHGAVGLGLHRALRWHALP